MKKLLLTGLTLLACVSLLAQRTGVREEILSSWNKSSGLDCVYDQSPKASTPSPKGYEAVYIGHYGRHGSRYAYTEKAYTIFLNLLSEGQKADNLTPYGEQLLKECQPLWDQVRYRVGDLTPLGWEQHQAIARTMVRSFPTAFGKGSEVDACSSPSARAIVSMGSFCASVSREAPQAQVYEHQSLTDVQATRPNSGANPFRYKGPEMVLPYKEKSENFFFRVFPEYPQVLSRLFKDTDAALANQNPHDVFFNLYMFVAGMNSLPENVRVDVSGIFTPQEYAKLWETDNYERFREYYPYQQPNASIVDDIIQKADEMLSAGKRGAHLRFGHDHVLMSLLMLMDIDDFGTVPATPDELPYWFQTFRSPMAGNIQLVFFAPKKGSGDILVKVLLNGEEARFGKLEAVSGPYYKWADVKAFLNARIAKYVYRSAKGEWTSAEVAPGLVYRSFMGLDPISGSAQQVFVADWDMKVPGFALKFFMSEIPEKIPTSEAFKRAGAVVAMNAAYEPPSIVLKVDGENLFNMPNNTIMATGVPNWKNEAALYIEADGKVRIAYEGKGRTREQLRSYYAASEVPNIYTSAPMLIDNFNPVGESFAGFYSEDAMTKFNYEDYVHHQGVRHPRTVVASTADDHLLLIVVDGRRDGISEGMSARELTRFLVTNFNPQYAINMDGGGSTTLCVEGQGDPNTHVVNYPSGSPRMDHGGERSLYSFICLVRE